MGSRRHPATALRGAAIRAGLWTVLGIAVVAVVWLGWNRAVTPAADGPVDAVGPTASDTRHDLPGPRSEPAAPVEPLWRAVAESSVADKPPLGEGWSAAGRRLVDVANATAAAHAWREGGRFAVDIPQLNVRYEVLIDRVADGPARSRTARGVAMDADGRRRRVVVTVGPGRTFAYVDTAGGPYELVGDGKWGWLLPSSSMMAGVDFAEPDYVLVAPGRSIRDIRELRRGR